MKWVVGLDLRDRSVGAIHFARWLASVDASASFIGVHVLEQEHLLAVLRDQHLDEVLTAVRGAAEDGIRREGASGELAIVDVVQAVTAPEGLRDSATRLGAAALILGRAAPRGGGGLVRLGRVARRLLRMATLPVVIVPPDMREPDFGGDGPVIALTKLTDASVPPCRFAEAMARALGRRLVIAHGVDTTRTAAYMAAATIERVGIERRAEAEAALASWVAASGLGADGTEILAGNIVEEATALAQRTRAALLVAGSRHGGSALERLLVASTGSELAAAASRPVAIVPPPAG
jgi:nucleotide-binding universal stress UspA family protein